MQTVIDRYIKAIAHQLKRRNREGRDRFTPNENKAIAHYGLAVQTLTKLNA